jgi:hypothetical protein
MSEIKRRSDRIVVPGAGDGAASPVRHINRAGYKPSPPKPQSSARPPSAEEQRRRKARELEAIADRWLLRRR